MHFEVVTELVTCTSTPNDAARVGAVADVVNRVAYAAHRWLALIVGAQLLAWSLGGLMFALLDIDEVHGDLDRVRRSPSSIAADVVPIAAVLRHEPTATSALLAERRGRLAWQLVLDGRIAVFDARTGARLPDVDAEEAGRIALADTRQARGVVTAELFTADAPIEYREKPLPAWRVVLDHDRAVHVYVHAVTGEVTARRNGTWRLFDFFWMLHVMDYSGREDFQHPLLIAFASLAVLTSASGLGLWALRLTRRMRRRPTSASSPGSA